MHPSIPLFGAALALPFLPKSLRAVASVLAPALALGITAGLGEGSVHFYATGEFTLELLRVDALSRLFAAVFCLVGIFAMVYAAHLEEAGERASALALMGGALGVVFAGDWLSMFVFWELMSLFSLFVIWFAGSAAARGAGTRYLLVHVLGGGTLFAGILLHRAQGGAESFTAFAPGALDAGAWLILAGIAVNAAIPPLHTWLTDAYPECSVTGSVVQSAFTTKTAVYALLRAFPGQEALVFAGVAMALFGVVYAVFANDIRRLLAYHIVSQVGFMVAGIGLGTALSLNGASAHAFCHILYKGLLFMSAGAVITAAGSGKLTELGGLARRRPEIFIFFLVGALSISGAPPFNGFISKTMTIAAFGKAHLIGLEMLLELASVGTFLSIGLKLSWFAFLAPGADPEKPLAAVPGNMAAGMGGLAALCLLFGVWPDLLYRVLPYAADYHPYTALHVLGSLQLHVGTVIGFWLFLGVLAVKPAVALDFDWLYRKPGKALLYGAVALLKNTGAVLQGGVPALSAAAAPGYDVDGKRLPVGFSIFWISLFLGMLAFYAF